MMNNTNSNENNIPSIVSTEKQSYEIGSEFNYIKPDKSKGSSLPELFETTGRNARYLRCGRDAIGFIAEDITKKQAIKGNDFFLKRVYMPALACDSMVEPFRMHGYKVLFYKVQKDLRIDTAFLLELIKNSNKKQPEANGANETPVILTMNYFSMVDQRETNKAVKAQYPDAIIVEDITQVLLSPEAYDLDNTDYQIGSIRKWFGLADGAVVLAKDDSFEAKAEHGTTAFTTMRTQAMTEKTKYHELVAKKSSETASPSVPNNDMTMQDAANTEDPQALKAHFRGMLSSADDALDNGMTIYEISEQSYEDIQYAPLKEMMEKRTDNYHYLYQKLKEILEPATTTPQPFTMFQEAPVGVTPFMLPILVNESAVGCSRDEFERKLAQKGVYAPVLWPIEKEAQEACSVSADFSQHMLAFWIDHRYTREHMDYVAEQIRMLI